MGRVVLCPPLCLPFSSCQRLSVLSWSRGRGGARARKRWRCARRMVLLAPAGRNNTRDRAGAGDPSQRGRQVAFAFCRASPRRPHRRAASRTPAHDHRRAGRGGDRQDAGEHAPRCDALVDTVDGPRGRADAVGGPAHLEDDFRAPTPPPTDLEALQGSAVHRQGPRRRRALPGPTRARRRALRRREVPDPGLGSHRADPADAARHASARHPRLPARRNIKPLRRAGHHDRPGHRRPARPPPRDRVQRSSCRPSTARSPPTSTSTWSSTTAPPTRRRRSAPGWPPTRGSSCTSPPRRARG